MTTFTYFDYASLVRPVPAALDAMREAAEKAWGPLGALHTSGGRAVYALDMARRQVSDYLGTVPQEVVFTSSGRDALTLGFSLALERVAKGAVIVASRLDHPSLQRLVEDAANAGYEVQWLELPEGVPSDADRERLRKADLVAVSLVNHELGTSLVDALGDVAPSAVRLLDAVQAAPWLSLQRFADERTFYAVSGAKLGAPMGVGVLRVPSSAFYAAREQGRPLESSSPPWIVAIGLGAACEVREPLREDALARARRRGEELRAGLEALEPGLVVNGAADTRLGTVLNVSFPGRPVKSIVSALSLEGVCISHTAACQARSEEMSPVVRAAYPSAPERAASATRWSVSESVTEEDVKRAVEAASRVLRVHRKLT